ncbi:MAG: cytochrome c oxidase subunit II [Silvibacterium sp.]|nr:cytochrome c oxidase subunit II [Silvibacterium sp.]
MLPKWLRVERIVRLAFAFALALSSHALAEGPQTNTHILSPVSTPATQIYQLSLFIIEITGAIFVVVAGLLTFVIIRFRERSGDDQSEPAQVYGSNQVELAWTVIPVLIVVVLFLTTARVIFAIQDAPMPQAALEVTSVGHQFWWEYRYPKQGLVGQDFVAVNELHVPLSSADHPTPTYIKLLSADVVHSFWVPQLMGKIDLIPNHPNDMWIDPLQPGIYLGQCAQFCGVQHANMLLRVYVDSPERFAAWAANQARPAVQDPSVAAGRHVFETQACMNCHVVRGTVATGRFGPDLTHLASRDTLASGMIPNTRDNLRAWIKNPDAFKPGCLMPAMQLTDEQIDQVTNYLETLK